MTNQEWLLSLEHEDFIVFANPDFDDAIVGITTDNQVVYDYEKMIEHLMNVDGMDSLEAAEFIDCNTLRSLPYAGHGAPIIMYSLNLIDEVGE